VELEETSAGPG